MPGYLITPHEGKSVWLGPPGQGLGVDFKIYGEDTGGSFSIVEHPIPPGTFAPPHTHTREDEYSYVLEGVVGARIGDEVIEATPGCYVLKPRGVPHAFWNAGPQPARIIEIISPAGFENYFAEAAELVSAGGPPDVEAIIRLASGYGLILHMELIPELVAKYKLNWPG
jgi:quercetin dioxygenase-like cupin family protein